MKSVICDICGTVYPADAESCPICGSAREYALESQEADFSAQEAVESKLTASAADTDAGEEELAFEIPGDDAEELESSEELDEDSFDDEEDYQEESGTNTPLVIVLVILIVLLLLVSGFFFVRYLLPAMDAAQEEQTVPTTAPVEVVTTEATELKIPCTNLMMDGGKVELGEDGKRLLNVRVYPEDTTDALTYISGDESVVTVSDSGTVTAVGEGQTVITVKCGSQQINCSVTVDYSVGKETVAPEEVPAVQAETEAEENAVTETAATEETAASEETTEATQAPTEEIVLALKQTDMTISHCYESNTLELEGGLQAEQVTWFTLDDRVAIVHDGVVTSTGAGITRIYAEYQGQQVFCIIRCNF